LAAIISENLAIAGDSPVLHWLVAACGRAAPWLRLEADALVIDWQMLLHQKAMADAPPHTALLALLPSLPLAIFNTAGHGSPRHARLATFDGAYGTKTTLLPDSLRKLFSTVVAEGAALLPDLIEAQQLLPTSNHDYSVIYHIGLLAGALRDAVCECDIKAVSIYTRLGCTFDKRLLVAGGDIDRFLFGRDSDPYGLVQTPKPHEQLRARRVARRLLRTNLEFLATLTGLTQDGTPGGLPELTPEAKESCQRLAQLERELFGLISSPSRFSAAPTSTFLIGVKTWATIGNDDPTPMNQRLRRDYSTRRHRGLESPLGYSINTLDLLESFLRPPMIAGIEARCRGMNLAKLAQAVSAAHNEAQRFDIDVVQHSSEPADATTLVTSVARAIDCLIAESPLLTLFASGVLQTYPLPSEVPGTSSYGISLSPWLVASAVATKVLGSEPMTYIDALEVLSEEPDVDEGKRTAKATTTKPTPSGRLLWDLAQRSLA